MVPRGSDRRRSDVAPMESPCASRSPQIAIAVVALIAQDTMA
jgi:hypothetical protein